MEEQKKKKEYEKPKVTRITLDAKCAVLGFCKGAAGGGPAVGLCVDVLGSACVTTGS